MRLPTPPTWLWIALAAATIVAIDVATIAACGPWDPWETHYGEVSRQILVRNDPLDLWWKPGHGPDGNAENTFWSKPALPFWLMALSMAIFGVGTRPAADEMVRSPLPELALRLPSLLAGTLCAAFLTTLRVGHPLDKAIDMGAIVAPVQLERIKSLVAKGVTEGAELFQPDIELPKGGCFYPPTLLSHVQSAASVAQEEIFGPVLVSMTFRTPDEAVMLANNKRYGLASSIWSETIGLALDIAPKLQAWRGLDQCDKSL